jgi:aryl-alcohol dehydrogenase-like predicted oxidoreductase
MRYRLLGNSGVRISEVALGTMTFGEDWGWGASPDISERILDLFADAGGNVIDTADVYTNGTSETILGELLKGRFTEVRRSLMDAARSVTRAASDATAEARHFAAWVPR